MKLCKPSFQKRSRLNIEDNKKLQYVKYLNINFICNNRVVNSLETSKNSSKICINKYREHKPQILNNNSDHSKYCFKSKKNVFLNKNIVSKTNIITQSITNMIITS